MLGWFRALMPKEERFFDLFTRHAQITLAGAQALSALLKGGDDVLLYCREITWHENEADEITRHDGEDGRQQPEIVGIHIGCRSVVDDEP